MVLLTISVALRREKSHHVLDYFVALHNFRVVEFVDDLQVLLVGVRHNIFFYNFAANPSSLRTPAVDHLPNFQILLLNVVVVQIREREVVLYKSGEIKAKLESINIIIFAQMQMLQH